MAEGLEATVEGVRAAAAETSSPLVSVIIPAYNCAAYIEEALESVYRQTYPYWEIIVVDDGSTDGTSSVLAAHRERIQYFAQPNRGTAAARNTGIRRARGELIAFLDNDDIWLPEKLELQVRALNTWPECGLVFTDGKTFTSAGVRGETVLSRRIDGWLATHQTADPLIAQGRMIRELLFWNEISSASGVMVRRACVEHAGGFDETISITDDYDLWLRIASGYPVAVVRKCLYMWRWHDSSQSGPTSGRMNRWTEARLVVLEKQLPVAPAVIRKALRAHMARLYWGCARYHFDGDRFGESRRMLTACLRHNPTSLPALGFLLATYLGGATINGLRRVKHGLTAWRAAVPARERARMKRSG